MSAPRTLDRGRSFMEVLPRTHVAFIQDGVEFDQTGVEIVSKPEPEKAPVEETAAEPQPEKGAGGDHDAKAALLALAATDPDTLQRDALVAAIVEMRAAENDPIAPAKLKAQTTDKLRRMFVNLGERIIEAAKG